jgi:hypothetical protein
MSQPVFILKVALSGRKGIWRRIAIRGSQTLDDLHEAIYCAFDRYDEHLYSFYFPKPGTKGRARLRDAEEYTRPFNAEENDFSDEPGHNAAKAKLADLGLKRGQKFLYLFDFGDSWWHDITVEKIDAPAEKGEYPCVLEKHGKSPPQYPDYDDEDGEEDEEDEEE